jgi:hypothetical protein
MKQSKWESKMEIEYGQVSESGKNEESQGEEASV